MKTLALIIIAAALTSCSGIYFKPVEEGDSLQKFDDRAGSIIGVK